MVKRIVTIDIDSKAIRLMETRGDQIEKWASAQLGPGLVENGLILHPRALGASIKLLLESSGVKAKGVIASVSGIRTLNRTVVVPEGSEAHIQASVLEKARKEIPVPLDELHISWHTVAVADGQRQVFITGIPRDMVNSVVQALKAAGLILLALEIKTVALARMVSDGQALIINIEPYTLDIALASNGILRLLHTTTYKEDLSVEELIEQIVKSLDLVVDFYNSRYPLSPIDPSGELLVTGQIGTGSTFIETLQDAVGYKIKSLVPSLKCPQNLPLPQYAVNLGLALRMQPRRAKGRGFSHREANILPAIDQRLKQLTKQALYFLVLLIASGLFVPFYQALTATISENSDLRARAIILDQRFKLSQIEGAKRDKMMASIQEFEAIAGKQGSFLRDLKIINDEAEALGIKILSISHQGKKVIISSQAVDQPSFEEYRTAYSNYTKALVKTGSFSYAEHSPLNFPPQGKVEIEAETRK